MPPPLYTPSDDETEPDATPPPVITGPATAPLYSTGGLGTMFGDTSDVNRFYTSMYQGKGVEKSLAVGDPGVGSPSLGEVDTTKAFGVAIPEKKLQEIFGKNPAAWRSARVQITSGDKTFSVPIIDVGPGKGPQKRGVVTDLSSSLWQALGLDPSKGLTNVKIQIQGNAGPDYTSARANWDKEQQQLAQLLGTKQGSGATESPTPWTNSPGAFSGINNLANTAQPNQNTSQPNQGATEPSQEIDYSHLATWLATQ